ncbi:MAG: hypothetical protein ABIJ09_26500 [Pseudomonadota bacterium]
MMPGSRRQSWRELLADTLGHAVRAPYYRRAFGQRWRRVHTLDDLALLPVLDKVTAMAHQHELLVGPVPPGVGIASSGTTRNSGDHAPLMVRTSDAEAEAMAVDDVDGDPADTGWTVVVVNVKHGLPAGPPPPREILVPWLHHPNAMHLLEAALESPTPDGRHADVLRISVGALRCFTVWQLEQGRDPRRFGLRVIGTNSFRLSPFWRERIGRAFGATLVDNYSLSEFATPATECSHCGWLHWGWPPVIYEVVDLCTGQRRTRGEGLLLLTGIFPYVQTMPLIRYDTGDVVELGPRCKVTGQRGLRCLGRLRRGVVVRDGERGRFVLSPLHVQDVLEAMPEVERGEHPMVKLGFLRCRDIGLPRWQLHIDENSPRHARLDVELRLDPNIFDARARELERQIRADVMQVDAPLRAILRKGLLRFEVRAVAAQSLQPLPDKA